MKKRFIKILSYFGKVYLQLKGLKIASNLILTGLPRVRMYKGSSIIIENGVTIHSLRRFNAGISKASHLVTDSSSAKIILKKGCGISGTTIISVNEVVIGEDSLIGADSYILDSDRHFPLPGTKWGHVRGNPEYGKPIHIGKGCFIGARSIILKGVTIGDGAVVAAGAVVTRDVPSGYLAMGNPATNHPLPERLKHPVGT